MGWEGREERMARGRVEVGVREGGGRGEGGRRKGEGRVEGGVGEGGGRNAASNGALQAYNLLLMWKCTNLVVQHDGFV